MRIKQKKQITVPSILGIILCAANICLGQIIPKVYTYDSLIIKEYPIDKSMIIPQEILKKREEWSLKILSPEEATKKKIDYMNKKLIPLGYRFIRIGSNAYDFYKGKDLVKERLSDVHGFSMDSKEHHFVFLAWKADLPYPECKLVCVDGDMKTQKEWGLSPIWVNDELLRINYLGQIRHMEIFGITNGLDEFVNKSLSKNIEFYDPSARGNINILIKGTTCYWDKNHFKIKIPDSPYLIFTFIVPIRGGGGPIIMLQPYREGWVLEAEGRVFINGTDLCKEKNYGAIEGFSIIKGKPFYFFVLPQDLNTTGEWPYVKKVRISYDGKVLPVWYNWVGAGRLADGMATAGPFQYENMVCFYARRGKQWFYVETGIHKPSQESQKADVKKSLS